MPQPARGAARVRVPATSANLGPGFDALGLALQLHDDVSAEIVADGLHIDVAGEGAAGIPRDESHLIVQAIRTTFERLDAVATGLSLRCRNEIPHGRGLGSSAAAICAGVLLARALVADGRERLDDRAVLALAAEIEGHPDNVAACLLGGLTLAWTEPDGSNQAIRLDPSPALTPVVFIPDFESSTEVARRLLPATVPHADAAFNAARTALLVATLTGDLSVLLAATEDRLHQPYRATAMLPSAELVRRLRTAGIAAVISGAGPTVLALADGVDQAERAVALAGAEWRALPLAVDRAGATAHALDPR